MKGWLCVAFLMITAVFLGACAGPIFNFSNLGQYCSAAFTTAFISGVAANSMLLNFYAEGKISRRQMYLANFVNQFPAFFLHLPTTLFIIIPLTGMGPHQSRGQGRIPETMGS